MAQRAVTLSRGQMLRAMPKHLLWAAAAGAVAGAALRGLDHLAPSGWLAWAALIAMGGLYANAAVMPVTLPGRHWSFAFIGAMMLFLLLVAGGVLAPKFPFPHSFLPPLPPHGMEPVFLPHVNAITWLGILTGGCLGLLYGLLVGRTGSMVVGLALGSASGYAVGIASLLLVGLSPCGWGCSSYHGLDWRWYGLLHLAWQGALFMVVVHFGASLGAAMGAGAAPATANPQSEIEHRKCDQSSSSDSKSSRI